MSLLLSMLVMVGATTSPNMSTPLNQWPMIQVHDAATGYLTLGNIIKEQLMRWTKTQGGNATTQLDCGARAFDWRPALSKSGELIMHHGDVLINHPMEGAVSEMVAWANANQAPEDLVVLFIWDCTGGDACNDKVTAVLKQQGVPQMTSAAALKGYTLGDAIAQSKLAGGGHLLAITDTNALNQHYDPSQTCSGNKGVEEYTCYTDSSSKAYPVDRMFAYLNATAAAPPPADGTLYAMQALWEESAETVAIGELHDSSLILDEVKSNLNGLLISAVKQKTFKHLNFVEVNNICDKGAELLEALRANYVVY